MARPLAKFHDFVGQRRIVQQLVRHIRHAKKLDRCVPHMAFFGPSGTGKTLLARSVAKEVGGEFVQLHGRSTRKEIVDVIESAQPGSVVFLDEVHAISSVNLLCLFPILCGGSKGSAVPTIIVATDKPGALERAFTQRFLLTYRLSFYSRREMGEIVGHLAANVVQVKLTGHAKNRIAAASCGNPRQALHILTNLQRWYLASDEREISCQEVKRFLKSHDYDDRGLTRDHYRVMNYLSKGGRCTQKTLVAAMGLDKPYVEQVLDPPLLYYKLVEIDSTGRRLTKEGHKLLADAKKARDSRKARNGLGTLARERSLDEISHVEVTGSQEYCEYAGDEADNEIQVCLPHNEGCYRIQAEISPVAVQTNIPSIVGICESEEVPELVCQSLGSLVDSVGIGEAASLVAKTSSGDRSQGANPRRQDSQQSAASVKSTFATASA